MNTQPTYIVQINDDDVLVRVHSRRGACLAAFARPADIEPERAALRYGVGIRWTIVRLPLDDAIALARQHSLNAVIVHDGDTETVHEVTQ